MALKRNRYKLVSGSWDRWEGGYKEAGRHVRYDAQTNPLVENVTLAELASLGARLVHVAGTSANPVPDIPDMEDEPVETPKPVAKQPEPETEEPDADDSGPSSWAEVVSGNLKDVIAAVNVLEDLDDLAALRKAEMKGQGRKGVINAIKDRKAALTEG